MNKKLRVSELVNINNCALINTLVVQPSNFNCIKSSGEHKLGIGYRPTILMKVYILLFLTSVVRCLHKFVKVTYIYICYNTNRISL